MNNVASSRVGSYQTRSCVRSDDDACFCHGSCRAAATLTSLRYLFLPNEIRGNPANARAAGKGGPITPFLGWEFIGRTAGKFRPAKSRDKAAQSNRRPRGGRGGGEEENRGKINIASRRDSRLDGG